MLVVTYFPERCIISVRDRFLPAPLNLFGLFCTLKIGMDRNLKAFSISCKGVVEKVKYWKRKCPGSVPAYATSNFRLFLDWKKLIRENKKKYEPLAIALVV